jgi:hypothetical protein
MTKTKDYDDEVKADKDAKLDKDANAPVSTHYLSATGGGRKILVRLSAIDAAIEAGDPPNLTIRLLLRSGEGLTIDATDEVWTAIRGALDA